MPTPTSTTELLDLLKKSGVVRDDVIAQKLGPVDRLPPDPAQSAAVLVQKGILTKFQAKLLLAGRHRGFKLGAYVIREQIGQGGMGAVYLAEHETLRRKVALKVLTTPKGESMPKLAVERFVREARAAAALDHPNIVRLHDIAKDNGVHFLVMEYVDGQTLDAVLNRGGAMAAGRAATYVAQAAAGLQHAHEKGFIHRDIKPGNLILTKDGTVKILDMGLARQNDDDEERLTENLDKGAVVGTADYISPEQAMNGDVDIRSDIYSLGATFYALVAGSPPFSGSTTQKLLQHQLKDAPTLADLDHTIPQGLSDIVEKMLHKIPSDRYQTPAELILDLAEWVSESGRGKLQAGVSGPVSAELENTITEVRSKTKRMGTSTRLAVRRADAKRKQKLIAGGIAAAVVVVAGVLGAVAFGPSKAKQPPVAQQEPDAEPAKVAPPKPAAAPEAKAKPDVKAKPAAPGTPAATPAVMPKMAPGTLVWLPVDHMKPFSQTLGSYMDGTVRRLRVINEEGPGLPKPWYRWIENLGAEAEIALEDSADGNVFAIRGLSGPAGVMVTSPEFKAPAEGKVVVSLTYSTEAEFTGGAVRLRQTKPTDRTWVVLQLTPTKGMWQTVEKEIELKGAEGGLFELSTQSVGANTALRFRSFEVTGPK